MERVSHFLEQHTDHHTSCALDSQVRSQADQTAAAHRKRLVKHPHVSSLDGNDNGLVDVFQVPEAAQE